MVATAEGERVLLTDRLRSVSRAFYLTLRVLPRELRRPVGLAYLLARAADTVADAALVLPDERLAHLVALRDAVLGRRGPPETGSLLRATDDGAERRLLEEVPALLAMLGELPEADRARVRSIVEQLTRGMEYDLTVFPAEDSGRVRAVEDFTELDRYTYLVAGCVGEFWTEISMAHLPPLRSWDRERMSQLGVRFGKALQLTNVLRDVPADLRIGRCYLPRTALEGVGLAPEELLDPSSAERARPVLLEGIQTALGHFGAGERYLLAIPRRCYRTRLAVLWPLLMGLATLEALAANRFWLDVRRPSKVPRSWVYRTVALSLVAEPSDRLLRGWIASLASRARRALLISPPVAPRPR